MRGCGLVRPAELTFGYFLASYANADGSSIRVGHKKIIEDLGYTEETIGNYMKALRAAGLIERVSLGSPLGRKHAADEHRLTVPDSLLPILRRDEAADLQRLNRRWGRPLGGPVSDEPTSVEPTLVSPGLVGEPTPVSSGTSPGSTPDPAPVKPGSTRPRPDQDQTTGGGSGEEWPVLREAAVRAARFIDAPDWPADRCRQALAALDASGKIRSDPLRYVAFFERKTPHDLVAALRKGLPTPTPTPPRFDPTTVPAVASDPDHRARIVAEARARTDARKRTRHAS